MRFTRRTIISSGLAALLAVSFGMGCGGNDDGANDPKNDIDVPGEVAKSTLKRELAPAVSASDAKELAEDNRDFAFDLYHVILDNEKPGNLFYSPHSISIALAMAYGGARGETATEMADALKFGLGQDKLHAAFNKLDLELAKRKDSPVGEGGGEPFQLSVVNATWGQKGYSFQDSYLDLLAVNYGAGLNLMDFKNETEASRKKINQWVEDQTNNRIKDLLPAGVIDADTRLVLTNAIFFKAGWAEKFAEGQTKQAAFTQLDGATVQVDMMMAESERRYAMVDGHQIAELAYVGGDVSMVVMLPEEGGFESFEDDLDGDKIGEYLEAMKIEKGTLKFPKFSFGSDVPLKESLEALGMKTAFMGAADFSGIDGTKELLIADVLHKSFVAVDEEGTEAAAATAVVFGPTSAPEPEEKFEMTVDRPFIFVIRDNPTGAILFVGRVVDPS